jgi:glycine/D-amino acid oxidase-like deaminating enzyme
MATPAAHSSLADLGTCDIVFVGAGWGGLSGATRALWHKAQGRELKIILIEAGAKGERMASRNNAGFLAPDFAHSLVDYAHELCEKRVAAGASTKEAEAEIYPQMRAFMGLTLEGCANFFDFAATHHAGPLHKGSLHKGPMLLVNKPSSFEKIRETIKRLNENFGLAPLTQIGRRQVKEILQTSKNVYAGGWVYEMGGFFEPAPVYDAILKSLRRQGVKILHNCKAKSALQDEDGFIRLQTSQGEIRTRFLVMSSAYSQEINPDAFSRIMFYAPHAYVAETLNVAGAPKGVWAFEDNGKPSYYANSTGERLYYGAVDTLANTPWDNADATRFSNTATLEIWDGWKDIFHQTPEHKTARLHTTTSGFPELSEELNGRVITSGGHDDRGIGTSAYAAKIITDVLVQRAGFAFDAREALQHYALLQSLPRGAAMSSAEKAKYLKKNLPNLQRITRRHDKRAQTPGLT